MALNIAPCTWPEFYDIARRARFHHPQRLHDDVESLKPACSDLTPFVFDDRAQGVLLIAKGKLLEQSAKGPAVFFIITLRPQYPNAYPILSVEPPPEGWRIKNHPAVNTEGLCFLAAISRWQPRTSKLFDVCAELQIALTNDYPFERGAAAPPPPAPPSPPPPVPAQPYGHPGAGAPASRGVPQAPPGYAAPPGRYHQPPPPGGAPAGRVNTYHDRRGAATQQSVLGALVGGLGRTTTAILFGGAAAGAGGAAAGGAGMSADERQRMQRDRDKQWLTQQQQRRQQEAQADQEAAQKFLREKFQELFYGGKPLGPNVEISLPLSLGIGKVRTHPLGAPGPMTLAGPRPYAPAPLPPVTEPTPDDYYEQKKFEEQQARARDQREDALKPAPKSVLGRGWSMMTKVAKASAALASDAGTALHDKVRNDAVEKERTRFATLFPAAAESETMKAAYHAMLWGGNGIGYHGYLFITTKNLYWGRRMDADTHKKIAEAQKAHEKLCVDAAAAGQPAPPPFIDPGQFTFQLPLAAIVSIVRGECLNAHYLHLVDHQSTVRTLTEVHEPALVSGMATVSSNVAGNATDRCYNWLDHLWRASAPVPCPGYQYLTPPSAAAATAPPAATGVYHAAPVPGAPAPPMGAGIPAHPVTGGAGAAPAPAAGAPPAAEAGEPKNECAICFENPKNAFLRPCGHLAVCMACAAAIDKCPICRAPIQEALQAFL